MQAGVKDWTSSLVFAVYHGKSWRSLFLWRAEKNPSHHLLLLSYAEHHSFCLLECQGCIRSSNIKGTGASKGPKEQKESFHAISWGQKEYFLSWVKKEAWVSELMLAAKLFRSDVSFCFCNFWAVSCAFPWTAFTRRGYINYKPLSKILALKGCNTNRVT